MPAIYPARLKTQVEELLKQSGNPKAFVHNLHSLLDFYSNRSFKPGQSGEPSPLIAQYNVPPPVLRKVITDLKPFIILDQQIALNLIDALWAEPFLEFKQLAAKLLGLLQPNPPEVIFDRIFAWGTSKCDDQLQRTVVIEGSTRLRQEMPNEYLHQVKNWLADENIVIQQIGLQAIHALLSQNQFGNLPAIFRVLTPQIRSPQPQLRADILEVVELLARHSPQETAAFLKQNLVHKAESPAILWIIRKSVHFFPSEIQESLRIILRGEK